MSTENKTSEPLAEPIPIHFECAEGCSPEHRKLRRALMTVVFVLAAAIAALLVYLALSGGFSRG